MLSIPYRMNKFGYQLKWMKEGGIHIKLQGAPSISVRVAGNSRFGFVTDERSQFLFIGVYCTETQLIREMFSMKPE